MPFRALLLSFSLLAILSLPCRADIWSPSSWNPLAKSKPSSVGMNRSNRKRNVVKSAGHTLAQHLPSLPSEFITKTKHVLPSSPAKPITHGHTVSRVKKKDEKPSFLKSMFVNEPPPPPRTVGEWMSLKRLDP